MNKGNNKRWRMLAAGCITLTLGGCGGEGGSSTPVTVPTPAPAPAPTPTPTPPAYATIFDLSVGQYLRSEVASVTIQRRYTPDATPLYVFETATARLSSDPQALIYEYNGVTRAVNLQFDGQTIAIPSSAMFTQTDDQMRSSQVVLNPDSWAVFSLVRLKAAFRYFAFSELELDWSGFPDAGAKVSRENYHRFLLGIETKSPDMPESGIRRYEAELSSSTVTYDGTSGLHGLTTMSVDFTARTVSGTFPTSQVSWSTGTQPVVATLNFDGAIDLAGNVIQGRVSSPDGFSGNFRGRLFGPAAEIGVIFTIERAGKGAVGTVGGVLTP